MVACWFYRVEYSMMVVDEHSALINFGSCSVDAGFVMRALCVVKDRWLIVWYCIPPPNPNGLFSPTPTC
ncbi:hypothetical protein VNO78_16656 [Psophocarpus tetragonolobus]|uniref:Uncharacterized protein n=1 Tax=Psophocarpus tetragonolobus TaxID=3891 RepID=A0AAN9SHG3_PSOTE